MRAGAWVAMVLAGAACGNAPTGAQPTGAQPASKAPPADVQLAVSGETITSTTTPFRLDLPGWTIEPERRHGRRVHVKATLARDGEEPARLELILQPVPAGTTADHILDITFGHLDQSNYSGTRRVPARIGGSDGVELTTLVSGLSPLLLAVAVRGELAVAVNCSGSLAACRDVVQRATWPAP